jgi:Uma2 family endonuclease
MRKDIISNLLTEPHAHLLIDEVYEALGREQERRIRFRNEDNRQEKVEFINGEVIVHSPVKKRHNQASLLLAQLLNIYSAKHSLGFVEIEKIMITLTRNDYEPDICFFKNEKAAHFTEDQILFPAPDLVVEILSDSTEERDRGVKHKGLSITQDRRILDY